MNATLAVLVLCMATAAVAQPEPAERVGAASETVDTKQATAASQPDLTRQPVTVGGAQAADPTPTLAPASVPGPVAPAPGAALEALLDEQPRNRDYVNQRSCIDSARIRRTETLNESFIVFYLRPRTIWVNQLPRPCDGLRADVVLSIESNQRQTCESSFVEPYNPDLVILPDGTAADLDKGGVSCRLGRFEQITQEQLDAIRQHIAH